MKVHEASLITVAILALVIVVIVGIHTTNWNRKLTSKNSLDLCFPSFGHSGKGNATVVLSRGYKHVSDYASLIARTQSVAQHDWSQNYDHLIFHEGNIPLSHQQYIQAHIAQLHLQFVNVQASFERSLKRMDQESTPAGLCPWYDTPAGYKCMCAFWFADFVDYTQDYTAILRIDEDCIISEESIHDPSPAGYTKIASVMYQGMDAADVTVGLQDFARSLCKEMQVIEPTNMQWVSPYTNVLWVSLKNASSGPVQNIIQRVVNTNCIMRNRWGDLPLWGLTMALLGTPQQLMSMKYYHGSHQFTVDNTRITD